MKEKLKSWLYLGWCTFVHFLKRTFRAIFPGKSGLKQFAENYITEGLIPVDASTDEAVMQALKCTSCGVCDSQYFEYADKVNVSGDVFVASFMRDISQAHLFKDFNNHPGEDLCPYEVQFSHFAGLKT